MARLMSICGVAGIVRGKRRTVTTEPDPSADRHPDLIDRHSKVNSSSAYQ